MIPALALAVLAAASPQPAPEGPPILFKGNVVLPDSVYLTVLDLPREERPSAMLARAVARRLRTFLRRGGYDLSTVHVEAEPDRLVVTIDEGRLDKIVVVGVGPLETVRLKLELNLPGGVFNRDQVERNLAEACPRLGIAGWQWELAPVESAPAPSAQIDTLEPLRGLPFLQPGRPYELRIFVTPERGGSGWSPEIEIDSLEGGGVGADYRVREGLGIGGRVAAQVRNRLDRPGSNLVLSRAWVEGRWAPFQVAFNTPEPVFRLRIDYLDRQRADLSLQRYDLASVTATAEVQKRAGDRLSFTLSGGFQRRFLFNLEPIGPLPLDVVLAPKAQNRPFGELGMRLVLDPAEIRRDRHHELGVSARLYPGGLQHGQDTALYLRTGVQTLIPRGWHVLWLRASATALIGDVPFADEEPVGAHTHGPFGGVFARRLVGGTAEFRYSLLRDLLKVGPYLDAVAFRDMDRARGTDAPRAGATLGIVTEALLFDQFVLEVYGGFGALSDGRNEPGLSLSLRQAY